MDVIKFTVSHSDRQSLGDSNHILSSGSFCAAILFFHVAFWWCECFPHSSAAQLSYFRYQRESHHTHIQTHALVFCLSIQNYKYSHWLEFVIYGNPSPKHCPLLCNPDWECQWAGAVVKWFMSHYCKADLPLWLIRPQFSDRYCFQ